MFCMYTYFCDILECFRSYPFGRAPFAQTLRISTEEGVVEVWARSVQCVARGLRSKVIFFRREWIRRFPGCLFKALSCVLFFEILVFLAYVSLWKRHGLPQLWVPLAGTGWGYIFMQVWAHCVPCAVCTGKAMLFFLKQKKQPAGPNSLGATLSLRTRVRTPARVHLFFVRLSPPPIFKWCVLLKLCSIYPFGTSRFATSMPSLRRDSFEVYYHSSVGTCRAWLVMFFSWKKNTVRLVQIYTRYLVAHVQLWTCVRGFEPWQKRFPLPLIFVYVRLFFLFFSFFFVPSSLLYIWSICPMDPFRTKIKRTGALCDHLHQKWLIFRPRWQVAFIKYLNSGRSYLGTSMCTRFFIRQSDVGRSFLSQFLRHSPTHVAQGNLVYYYTRYVSNGLRVYRVTKLYSGPIRAAAKI